MRNQLLVLTAMLLFPAFTTTAQANCNGKNLFDRLTLENPKIAERAAAIAAETINGNAVFWKIQKDGVKPSYLLGTMHTTDPRVTILTGVVEDALERSKIVAGEVIIPETMQEAAREQASYMQFMMPSPGNATADLLSGDELARVRQGIAMAGYPGSMAEGFLALKPWAVAMNLSLPICELIQQAQGKKVLDGLVQSIGRKNGARIVALETPEELFGLFDHMSPEVQKAWLLGTVAMGGDVEDMFESGVRLWAERKPGLLMAWNKVYMDDYGKEFLPAGMDSQEFHDAILVPLLDVRNVGMLKASTPLIDEGAAFIAVGAAHLIGEKGLVELYRQAGYKVTAVW